MKVDFHIHSKYSPDSFSTLHMLKKQFDKKGLMPLITDHGTIKGAMEYKRLYGKCIIAEEIETKEGEIIGLYLNEKIPEGMEIEETVERIKGQGGIVYLPHPFDRIRHSSLKRHNFKADIVEVFNSRVVIENHNKMAEKYAEDKGLMKAVGSDAHFARHAGLCYAEMDDFSDRKGMLRSLRNATLVKRKTPKYALAASVIVHMLRKPFFKP